MDDESSKPRRFQDGRDRPRRRSVDEDRPPRRRRYAAASPPGRRRAPEEEPSRRPRDSDRPRRPADEDFAKPRARGREDGEEQRKRQRVLPPSGTDLGKRPGLDPYTRPGPSPLRATLLSLASSGLGALFNGRLIRALVVVLMPTLMLGLAAYFGAAVLYLIAFGAGVITAPLGLTLLAGLVGWVPLTHPAVWLGLPIKGALVGWAALDAFRSRRLGREFRVPPWAVITYGVSMFVLLLTWIFTTGLATVRQPHMTPVLEPGDHIVINRLAFGLQIPGLGYRIGGPAIRRGERVAVLDPDGSGQLVVRRVFAVSGDRVDFTPPTGMYGVRRPMLGRKGRPPETVLWEPWKGPCVYALPEKKRRKRAKYARCRAFLETLGKRTYVVSYAWEGDGTSPKKPRHGRVAGDKVYVLADNRGTGRDSRHWGAVSLRHVRGRPRAVLWSWDPTEGIRWQRMGLSIADRP